MKKSGDFGGLELDISGVKLSPSLTILGITSLFNSVGVLLAVIYRPTNSSTIFYTAWIVLIASHTLMWLPVLVLWPLIYIKSATGL